MYGRPFSGKYEDFAFPNARDGWLVSARGEVFHWSDGGKNWPLQAEGMGTLRSVGFVDAKRGFTGTVDGVLYHTTDGGGTWEDITKQLPQTARGGMTHVDYLFSADAGKTWRYMNLRNLAQGLVEARSSFRWRSSGRRACSRPVRTTRALRRRLPVSALLTQTI